MWNPCAVRPLTLDECIFTAEQTTKINVKALVDMPSIKCPLFGQIGPFQRGKVYLVPLFVVEDLAEESVVMPIPPSWLTEDGLSALLKREAENEFLLPCPDPAYIELSILLFEARYNPWYAETHQRKTRQNAIQMFESYVQIRRNKINKITEQLILAGVANTTAMSIVERRRLGTVGAEYCRKLEPFVKPFEASLSHILTELDLGSVVNENCEQLRQARLKASHQQLATSDRSKTSVPISERPGPRLTRSHESEVISSSISTSRTNRNLR